MYRLFNKILYYNTYVQGETDIEQLVIVLKTLGYPNEEIWPGMSQLPDYNKIIFPPYPGIPWTKILPDADKKTIDFVKCFIQYDHRKRLTAMQVVFLIS